MRDWGWILGGLAVFLGLISLPFWYNRIAANPVSLPSLAMPADAKECVAPAEYMAASHWKLLGQWRDMAVRRNIRSFAGANGKTYEISLAGTCLRQCHRDKARFCDRCHAFHGLRQPSCWNCHVDPQQVSAAPTCADLPHAGEHDGS